jgi:serine/threonine protein kinase
MDAVVWPIGPCNANLLCHSELARAQARVRVAGLNFGKMTTAIPPSSTGEIALLRTALRGQYAIERELGRGGMGIVLLARDERLDRHVALKVLPPALAEQQQTRERFLREARMAAQLSHPNIVPVHRADEIGGFAFFAMGYVDGETLADRIRDRGSLPPHEVVRFLREVAWALAYAHARGIVHRDVKPENILIERGSGRAIVTDFGIARADYNPALTADGHVLGTVHYMSPEQATGENVDGRSDLYALGCVGFLALSGRLPFEASTPQAILIAHATRQPPPLRSLAPTVPQALAAVIDRCLAKNPDARFATGEELADAVGKAFDSSTVMQQDSPGASSVISSEAAMAVWRRAAELQAEAAARLESRMRNAAETRSMVAVSPDQQSGSDKSAPDDQVATPADSYRLRDVEAAALEVGISQKYVALALAELKSSPERALERSQPTPEWKERLATRLLGTTQRSLSASRIFRHPPRVVLQALGRTLQAPPYSLQLLDTLGGHPLDGGVLVFRMPDMGMENYKFTWTRYGVWVKELRVTLSQLAGDTRGCEVTVHVDLREGLTTNVAGYGAGVVGLATGGGLISTLFATQALAMTGVLLAAPIAGGAAIVGLAAMLTVGPIYRWEMRRAIAELDSMLAAVDGGIRSLDVFGEMPQPAIPRRAGDGYSGF